MLEELFVWARLGSVISMKDTANKIDGKVVLMYAVKSNGGMKVWFHSFLTSSQGGSKRPGLGPGRFTPGEQILVPPY